VTERRQVVLDVPLTPQECADLAGVHYITILRRIHAGHLRAHKPAGGREYIVHPQDFADWLYGRPVEPSAEPAPRAGETARRGPAARGSVQALDDIEREAV
jgi:excisionase family DNA binding protein